VISLFVTSISALETERNRDHGDVVRVDPPLADLGLHRALPAREVDVLVGVLLAVGLREDELERHDPLQRDRFLRAPEHVQVEHPPHRVNDERLAPTHVLLGECGALEVEEVLIAERDRPLLPERLKEDRRDVYDDLPGAVLDSLADLVGDLVAVLGPPRDRVVVDVDVLRIPSNEVDACPVAHRHIHDFADHVTAAAWARDAELEILERELELGVCQLVHGLADRAANPSNERQVQRDERVAVAEIVEPDLDQERLEVEGVLEQLAPCLADVLLLGVVDEIRDRVLGDLGHHGPDHRVLVEEVLAPPEELLHGGRHVGLRDVEER